MNAQAKPAETRHLPYDIEQEQRLIGLCMIDNRHIDALSEILTWQHFYDPMHQRIWDHLATSRANEALRALTPLTVYGAMKTDPGLADVGGHRYLANAAMFSSSVTSASEMRTIAREVVDLAARRALIQTGEDIVTAGYMSPFERPTNVLMAEAQRQVEEAFVDWQRSTGQTQAFDVKTISEGIVRRVTEGPGRRPIERVYTGLSRIDEVTGGMAPADYIILAGRSGNGKTALAGTIARNAARGAQKPSGGQAEPAPVLFFSLEMRRDPLVERMICDADYDTAAEPLHYTTFRSMRFTVAQEERIGEAQVLLAGLPLEIDDTSGLTMSQIAARARAFKARHGGKLGLVIVDYLQKVRPEAKDRSREQEVAAVSMGLVDLAKSLGWPIIALAQLLTKGSETKDTVDRPPLLRDIRESGQIEIDADFVWAIWRKARAVYQRKPDISSGPELDSWQGEYDACKNEIDILGLKNRHGEEFRAKLWCEIGASAVRDVQPSRSYGQEDIRF